MMSRLKTILLLFSCCLFCFTADAAHIVGGYMSYQCLGGDNYRFTLVLYRDCYGGSSAFDSEFANSFSIIGTVTLYAGSSNVPLQVVQLPQPTVETLPQLSYCTAQVPACLQQGTYVFDATMPSGDEPIHITYQRCCHNSNISNISGVSSIGSTWTITITPEARAVCNTSPVFGVVPKLCALIGEPFTFDHSATDADGDLLTYEFCAPLLGGGNDQLNPTVPNGVAPDPDLPPPYDSMTFLAPHSPSQPIPGTPAYTIDPNTGVISGTPNVLGRFMYAICVNEFRNGQLLSVTRFEFNHDVGLYTDTDELASPHRLKVFPNPNSGSFTVELPITAMPQQFEAQLYDINGQRVASLSAIDGINLVVTTPDLPSGVYQLLLRNGQEAFHERIMVQESKR